MTPPSTFLEQWGRRVDEVLDRRLPPGDQRPARLHQAMRYSVFAGGKRLRPALCVAACQAVGGDPEHALLPGAAIEVLHTYSLIHDDLPAMDDDTLRRGRPTLHMAFDEATAILAGDALLTLAFEWLACCEPPSPYTAGQLVAELARAAGSLGVAGGQAEDLAAEGTPATAELVDYIHRHKTAALLCASLRIGAIAGGAAPGVLDRLGRIGEEVGLAFQIADDILNATGTTEQLGKGVGTDEARGKATYVAVHGLEQARARAAELVNRALTELRAAVPQPAPLEALARFVVERTH